jgi:hypothetical protein
MYKIYLRQAFMHLWVQQSAEAFKFQQYVISIVLVQECAKQNGGGGRQNTGLFLQCCMLDYLSILNIIHSTQVWICFVFNST